MKKLYTILSLAFLSVSTNAQVVYIPDANFKAYLLADTLINTNKDTAIQISEAVAYKGLINVGGLSIEDLTGIEAFTAITDLNCVGNNLTSLNVSSNKALTSLTCELNSLTSLNVSSVSSLTYLDCELNRLTSLDVSSDSALVGLFCDDNILTSLNVKNGNNHNMPGATFRTIGNPNLICIEVDDTTYSNANWTQKDPWAIFSTNCTTVPVNEIATTTDINLYPNPFTSQLTLETKNRRAVNIKLYNVLGELVYDETPTGERVTINMNEQPVGVYFVRITDADGSTVSRKVVKQ